MKRLGFGVLADIIINGIEKRGIPALFLFKTFFSKKNKKTIAISFFMIYSYTYRSRDASPKREDY